MALTSESIWKLNLLKAAKQSSKYKEYKPIIAFDPDEVHQEYYDYYVDNGMVTLITVIPTQVINGASVFCVYCIDPETINAIYINDEALGIDISSIQNTGSYTSEYETLFRSLIDYWDEHNFNYVQINAGHTWFYPEHIKNAGETILLDVQVGKNDMIGVSKTKVCAMREMCKSFYIPLEKLKESGFYDKTDIQDIKDMCDTYLYNMKKGL